jgi:hypothetical protein
MGRTTALRREIKKTFLPHMASKGFVCDMRHAPQFVSFRKITSDAIYVCDIQWDKYGRPRFVVNFGQCGPHGVTLHGEQVLPQDIFPFHGVTRGRLSPGRDGLFRSGWFRQDRPLFERIFSLSKYRQPADVVSELMTLCVELEQLWQGAPPGKHVRFLP